MKLWFWTQKFIDVRECAVEAETEEEARAKMEVGDWFSERTVDFQADEVIEDLHPDPEET